MEEVWPPQNQPTKNEEEQALVDLAALSISVDNNTSTHQ